MRRRFRAREDLKSASFLARSALGLLAPADVIERERVRHVGIGFAAQLDIRKNQVIDTIAVLRWVELQVASNAELHPIHIMSAKEVIFFLLVLPGF